MKTMAWRASNTVTWWSSSIPTTRNSYTLVNTKYFSHCGAPLEYTMPTNHGHFECLDFMLMLVTLNRWVIVACLEAHCAAAHTHCYYVPISVGHGFNCTSSSVRHIFAYLLEGPENNPPLLGMKLLQRLSSLNSMCGYSCIGEVKGGGTNNEDSCKQVRTWRVCVQALNELGSLGPLSEKQDVVRSPLVMIL